jgi:hypothetical protein
MLKFAYILATATADLPISCPKESTAAGSTWTFHLNNERKKVSVYDSQELCTHQLPNAV